MERLPKKSYCKPCYKLCQRSLSTLLGVKFFNCHKRCNKYFNKHYLILYACVKNYMCHTYHNPRNQLPFPFQVKKNKKQNKTKNKKNKKTKKNQKQELRMRIFLGYHMDWKDRNVTYIYSFEPNSVLSCQGHHLRHRSGWENSKKSTLSERIPLLTTTKCSTQDNSRKRTYHRKACSCPKFTPKPLFNRG